MTTTIALDDELMAQAGLLTGLHENGALVRAALQALIEREEGRRASRQGCCSASRLPRHQEANLGIEDFG